MASNRLSYSLALYPIKMPKKKIDEVIEKLGALTDIDIADVRKKIDKAGYNSPRPIKLVGDIDQRLIAKVAEHLADLPGVSIEPDTIRFYPRGRVAAHLVGYTGEITDADGVPLAVSVERYDVAVNQRQVAAYRGAKGVPAGAAGVAQLLAPVLGANPAELGGSLVGTSTYRYLAKGVVPDVARQIRSLALPGIQLSLVMDRVYPKGTLAGNIVGFVGADGKGAQGLEYSLQDALTGANGSGI